MVISGKHSAGISSFDLNNGIYCVKYLKCGLTPRLPSVLYLCYTCVCSSAPQQGREWLWAWNKNISKRKRAWQTAKLHQHLEKLPTTSRRGQCSRVGVCWREALCEVGYGFLLWRIPRKWFSYCSVIGYSEVSFLSLSNFKAGMNFSLQGLRVQTGGRLCFS